MKEYKGVLFGFFETGSEGTWFALQENGLKGYDGIQSVDPGDHLAIYKDDEEMFSGRIKGILSHQAKGKEPLLSDKDFFAGWLRYPGNPKQGQLCIANFWVHWLPTNVDLKLWYDIFFCSPGKYVGKLRKDN